MSFSWSMVAWTAAEERAHFGASHPRAKLAALRINPVEKEVIELGEQGSHHKHNGERNEPKSVLHRFLLVASPVFEMILHLLDLDTAKEFRLPEMPNATGTIESMDRTLSSG